MSKDLLLEIGTEELPAGFIPKALASLEGLLAKNLEANRLGFKNIKTFGTPRRLALVVEGLSDRQPDRKVEVRGPQAASAFDAKGGPTSALVGFAKAQGVDLAGIKTVKAGKNEYVYAVKDIPGQESVNILPGLLKETISSDFFPKSMRWGGHDVSFARPVHWMLALYGSREISFEWGHIKSSSFTEGHRFLSAQSPGGPKKIKIDDAGAYQDRLREAFVIASAQERKAMIAKGLEAEATAAGGQLLADDGLLEEVTYLVEYPEVVRGSFNREFLGIPRDVVINAMREHQRYFSIIGADGELLPYFLTVANTRAVDMDVVRKGNERVLRARLNDAKFHFEHDIKTRLVDRAAALKGVVFQAKLGTSYEKAERFTDLALHIGSILGFSNPKKEDERPSDYLTENFNPAQYDPNAVDPGLYSKFTLGRAAMLSKADLTSGMVGEFPKLQGVMGCVYAKRGGEAPEVCAAIYEHYLPLSSQGVLPASVAGAIISIADKLDTIAGCFAVGLVPTGAQDPYALRRQALGVIAIVLDKSMRLQLDALVDAELALLRARLTRDRAEVREQVLEFFKDRLKNMLLSQGYSFDAIDAVLATPWFDMNDAVNRIKALEGFKKHPAAPSLSAAFKRVSNILKGIESVKETADESLLREKEESGLYNALKEKSPEIRRHWQEGDYVKAFVALASIKDRIDAFFDKVLVMAEDKSVRENRLALLNSIRNLYRTIADLSRLAS